jgi:hypothetical protein
MLDGVFEGALAGLVASYVVPALSGRNSSSVSKQTRALYVGAGAAFGIFLKPNANALVAFVPVPATPVVTKGYFAGSPRQLHPTQYDGYPRPHHSHRGLGEAVHHHVGAPPPGGDYSFTRRPGYNGKDY